ncbi:MAG: response regulator transcription factor [Oscillospiraceae bacterium]|jgi:DNA-binding response OmpR family regulator|nr:response regulator transcription factor [Oscillospiraceae bacterium]
MKKEILVIDRDEEVFEHIRDAFENEVISVSHVYTAEEGLFRMRMNNYSLIVMDVALSEQSRREVIAAMRDLQPMPILILSESASTQERVEALNHGADDFLAKPYELNECLAKAQALLRRYTELNYIAERGYAVVSYDKLLLDIARRTVLVEGEEVALSKKEFDVLYYLLKHRNRVLTYEQIYETVWNDIYMEDKSTIFFQIKQLRRKLGDPELIKSVHGIGYRIRCGNE